MPSERRLHPLSVLFLVGAAARNLLVPGLLVLFAGWSAWGFEPWLMLALVPYTAAALLRCWTFSYGLADDELVIRSGLVFRNERHIPYLRIQNVDLVQNPLHRLLGVAEVVLETAGGQEPEARIRVLSLAAADELRRRLAEARGRPAADVAPDEAPVERVLLELPLGELLRCGLVHNRGLVAIAAAWGLLWEFGLLDRIQRDMFGTPVLAGRGFFRSLLAGAPDAPRLTPSGVGLAALAALGLLALVPVLSMGWSMVKLYGFKLTAAEGNLKLGYGLLTRVAATIPPRRVQLVTVRQGPLCRWLDRVTIQVDTAATPAEGDGQAPLHRTWLAPLIRSADVARLLAAIDPALDPARAEWRRVDPRARRRILRRWLIVAGVAGVALTPLLGPWALLVPAALVPLALVDSRRQVETLGYALTPGAILFRSGWVWRRLGAAPYGKIQALTLAASPLDRRARMRRLRVDTAGAGSSTARIDIPYLEETVAASLFDGLGEEAARTALRW